MLLVRRTVDVLLSYDVDALPQNDTEIYYPARLFMHSCFRRSFAQRFVNAQRYFRP